MKEDRADPGGERERAHDLWRRFVNPGHVKLLEGLDFGRAFVRAEGTRLFDEGGREYTDFLAGYGVHNAGHNHPRIVEALGVCLESRRSSMLNVDAPLRAGMLAEKLTELTHPELCRTAFANSGAEAVEVAIKAARSATGRKGVVSCHGGYHGLSVGTISILGDDHLTRPFGEFLPECVRVPFGDAATLEEAARRVRPACFIVEPIQGEGGINVPEASYLRDAARVCRSHGVLFVVDEIQTGLGRTGRMFATDFSDVVPDVLLVGKALSGGMVPVSAAVMTRRTWKRGFSGILRCELNSSTFAGGELAMTAGLETIAVIEDEDLASRARELGGALAGGLARVAAKHAIVKEVRGRGLLFGVEFAPAAGLVMKAIPRWARDGVYSQVVSALLLRDHGMLTQPCTIRQGVLRVEPPLVVTRGELDRFVDALDETLSACPKHSSAVVAAFRKSVFGREL